MPVGSSFTNALITGNYRPCINVLITSAIMLLAVHTNQQEQQPWRSVGDAGSPAAQVAATSTFSHEPSMYLWHHLQGGHLSGEAPPSKQMVARSMGA